MSGTGTPAEEPLRADGVAVAIVAARWHGEVVDTLLAGAEEAAREAGATVARVVRVPGAFEIPVAARAAAARDDVAAVVALGVVMRGGTPHFDYVCRAVTDGCVRVSLDSAKPVGFGVLTVDDDQQAKERLDKGREAMRAALATVIALGDL